MSAFSAHVASFVILDGQIERAREGERVPHIELARRLAGADAASRAFVSGEVWERDGQVIAHVGVRGRDLPDADYVRLIRAAFPEHTEIDVRL